MKRTLLLPVCALLLLTTATAIRFSKNLNFHNETYSQQLTPPHFPGGEKALYKFLGDNLKWPDRSIDVQGKVLIGFYVEKGGQLTSIKILKGIGSAFDDEALRVIKKMPNWVSATKNGKPVGYQYTLPINFTLGQ